MEQEGGKPSRSDETQGPGPCMLTTVHAMLSGVAGFRGACSDTTVAEVALAPNPGATVGLGLGRALTSLSHGVFNNFKYFCKQSSSFYTVSLKT